jgi:hypothetical protein
VSLIILFIFLGNLNLSRVLISVLKSGRVGSGLDGSSRVGTGYGRSAGFGGMGQRVHFRGFDRDPS